MGIVLGQQDVHSLIGRLGLGGFINGERVGLNSDNRPLAGLGLGRNGLSSLTQPRPSLLAQLPSATDRLKQANDKDDEKQIGQPKEDQVDIQQFAQDAIGQALEKAAQRPRSGLTNEIVVSEDGRFQASIDLQLRSDGSFDLDIEVGFAEARSASMQEILAYDPSMAQITQSGFSLASVQQDTLTEFEQVVGGRDFEARLFYSEATHVAASVGQAYGSEVGGQVTQVAGELAREYTLNINISGASLESFNQQVQEIAGREDADPLLSGFLQAASNVINQSPDNVDGFFQATRSLLDNARSIVSSNLQSFFGGLQEQFGGTLEELGFGPDYFKKMAEESENGLNDFFSVTNNFFDSFFGPSVEDATSPEQVTENGEGQILESTLEQMREEQDKVAKESNGKSLFKQPSFLDTIA